eukprot:CAMPEP_0183714780 /NCGR_PEP_ID=MMETSP0737-20130205/9219_1 /TAXON_ID=385413 /ORGANISM="Thalassiosira miniscula, Strain CCMP1093" /LENGTH=653 /DNA_ID=CAMNT_0025943783 /DNA_START=52 /DNA_END=2013 /DNA_ORIENTATION=-
MGIHSEINTGGASQPLDNDPLAVFESSGSGGGGGGGAVANTDTSVIQSGGTADLLGTGYDANPREEEEILFDSPNGKMEQYELNNNDEKSDGSYESEEEEEDDKGDNLMDVKDDGWNLRQHRSGDDGDYSSEQYGTDNKTPMMDANLNGERNNSRRGFFGRWGSSRNNNAPPTGKPMEGFGNSNPDDMYNSKAGEGVTLPYGEGGITGDDDAVDEELEDEYKMDNKLRQGDHIYIWQSYGINPRAYQRHAVVFSVTRTGDVDPQTQLPPTSPQLGDDGEPLCFDMDTLYTEDEDPNVEVTVVSFYHYRRERAAHGAAIAQQAASGNSRGKRSGCKREYLIDFIGPDAIRKKKPIHKVRYGRKVKKGLLSQKAGVGTALKKDQVGLILARVQYVLDHPEHLPDHNALSANGECASLWCVTGRWCTLQGASILAITSVGQAGGALLAGGILSNLTILVPMPGVWGMAGWWWYVPATVAYPFLVPMLVTLGMASLVPLEILRRNRKKWRAITDGLNHEFWSNASEGVKEEFFGLAVTAEREAEMRTFFGVREGEATADDARYMPVGGAPGGVDDSDDDEESEALAMQAMERDCQNMAGDMKVDLSGKPPEKQQSQGGGWGSFMGSFRRNASAPVGNGRDEMVETERFRTTSNFSTH